MDEKGELCLQEEVGRLWEACLSGEEIAREMGVDVGWVEAVISMLDPEDKPAREPPC